MCKERILIQNSIKCGDLDLAYTTFTLLAANKQDWNWLKWNLLNFVASYCWYMLGEYLEFSNRKIVNPDAYKKLIYALVLADKSRDAYNLSTFVDINTFCREKKLEHYELFLTKKIFSFTDKMLFNIKDIYNDYCGKRELSDYEKNIVQMLLERIFMCGNIKNKLVLISAMILIYTRGLDKKHVNDHIKYAIGRYRKRGGGRPKKIKLDIKLARTKTPSYLLNETKIIKNPTCFQTMWGNINE